MSSRSDNASTSPAALLDELRALVSEAETLMTDTVAGPTAEAVSALRSRFQRAQSQLAALYTHTRDQVVAGARYTEEAIRTHPYPSVGIALGTGLIIGVLIGRRCACNR